jgi:hypothetical protein
VADQIGVQAASFQTQAKWIGFPSKTRLLRAWDCRFAACNHHSNGDVKCRPEAPMPLFICRWQNGDFSAVSASSKEEAIVLLDEVGNAEVCELFTAKNFMVHFHLMKEPEDLENGVPVEFEGFGEETLDILTDRVYPIYRKALIEADADWPDDEDVPKEKWEAAFKMLNDALITERKRQWGSKQPKLSSDPEVARLLQAGHDIPKTLAERIVKEQRRRKFVEMPPSSDKPQ